MNADLQAQLDRIADRLGISRGMTPGATAPRPPVRPLATPTGRSIEILIPGQEIETPHGPCFVREVVYPGSTLRSRYALAACLGQPLDTLAALYPEANLDNFDFARAAFLDTETSGLGGGAGTYAFMIGVGVFEPSSGPPVSQEEASAPAPPAFKVRQFFMRSEREERAVLHALAGVLDAATGLVSFNGRAFDLPLLTNRFIMHRQTPRLTTAPHLDLLHPARRVWRQRLPSCALSSLETQILGLRRDQADVPGWLIPSLYFQYLQTGDAQDLVGVFYHNLEDILSMVTLAATLTRLLADPWAGETIHALDMAALGYTYDQAGRPAEAERAYRDALSHPLPDDVRLQTYSRLGQLLKRLQRLSEAAETWQDWITHVTRSANVKDLEPYVELAKYHEWHANDCTAALMWTRWGEHEVEAWPRSPARREALAGLQHRHERLQRKLQGKEGA
ncbi:MAG: ribonuclease H-like domain-containing protein [Anaerolineae bacterium]|uniref:ribonuclease H-like domain-containing protein n=1 Tax=Candidatus Amarolinea dominans TaxID=3140696 RepID=UPI00313546B8|nr:ribonuclease H-like domain-containing protein [Anaerolineae bacterium]